MDERLSYPTSWPACAFVTEHFANSPLWRHTDDEYVPPVGGFNEQHATFEVRQ